MKIRRVIATISILAAAGYKLSPMILHKATAGSATTQKDSNSITNTLTAKKYGSDIGEVALTNHYETCVQLGNGKECILVPKLVDKGNAEITLTFESKTSAGKIQDMIVTQVDAKSGDPVEVALGDYKLTLTPNIVSE
jgi:hypothetical protein